MGTLIDGRAIAERMKRELKEKIKSMETKPVLAGLVVGGTKADEVYIRMRQKTADEIGARVVLNRMDEKATTNEVLQALQEMEKDKGVHGIIVHQPLPEHVDADIVSRSIPLTKDVEGMHPGNLGLLLLGQERLPPATPAAVIHMMEEEGSLKGAEVVVVSHSNVIGKPLALMLLNRDATVHVCHVHTREIEKITSGADILVTAAGVPGLVGADMVKEGAVVIDVSMNNIDGRLCGDLKFDEVLQKAGRVTPVPGGVGPVTNVMLFRNLLAAF